MLTHCCSELLNIAAMVPDDLSSSLPKVRPW
ncbi:Hypothetical protein NGAL_HAMBI1146_34230 [Neorhizobium galegae bv. officinalis]|nr:Hypothetical protein NGAL_HAMBI1146_34230 [Neorhizobium galegae bv. officinalis]